MLNKTLLKLGQFPSRHFMTIKELEDCFQAQDTIIDATEQRIQRPKDKEEQKAYYSGKKGHRVKKTIIAKKTE